MTDLEIKIDATEVERLLAELPAKHVKPALARALTKTAQNVRVAASKAIREKRQLSAKAVNGALMVRSANRNKLYAQVVATGRPIPLKEYGARQGKKGVTAAVNKGARKLVAVNGIKAFISEKLNGHVFARTERFRTGGPKDSRKIKKLFGPSIPQTLINAEVRKAWEATAKDSIIKRTQEEVRFELSKIAAMKEAGADRRG